MVRNKEKKCGGSYDSWAPLFPIYIEYFLELYTKKRQELMCILHSKIDRIW
jgi:hypothetical protein